MKVPATFVVAAALMVGSSVPMAGGPARIAAGISVPAAGAWGDRHAAVAEAYATLPLTFESNLGQTDPSVDFLARGLGYTLFVSADRAVLSLREAEAAGPEPLDRSTALRIKVIGGSTTASVIGKEELPGKLNSFIGNDPAGWRTNTPTYGKVVYGEVYPDIDLAFYGHQGRLEYDFVLKPGSDPATIGVRFDGADGVALDKDGNLVLSLGAQRIRQLRPIGYQDVAGKRPVPVRYRLFPDGAVGFDLGPHDPAVPVVIDPVLAYSTYLGGSGFDEGTSIAVDALGNAYVAGDATSTDFPTTLGAFESAPGTPPDVFVTKLSLLGNTLVYSTLLGGSADDVGRGLSINASGNVYVTGQTRSTDFPTTLGAFQPANAGGKDAFVTELNQQGSALVYSTYLGGADEDGGLGVAPGPSGTTNVTGYTISTNFPTTVGAFQTTNAGRADIFVAKLNLLATGLLYSTYLGGSGDDVGTGIAVGGSDNAYVIGYSTSPNYPTSVGAVQPASGGLFDAVAAKLNPLGTALVYSTYLGGSENDSGQGIALDASGSAYLAGYTRSPNFPTTPGSFQTANAGAYDAFVAKLNPLGNALTYSTLIGGSGDDQANAVAIDASGNAYLTGLTFNSPNFPIVNAFQTANAGSFDAFVTKLDPAGAALDYSSFLGGSIDDIGLGIAVDISGNAYVTGRTGSTDFPTTVNAFQRTSAGGGNAFIAKVGLLASTPLCSVTVNEGGWITAANGDMATFNGVVMTDAQNNVTGHEAYNDHGPAQAMSVDSTTILATTCSDDRTTASIFGRATIDGSGDHLFRVDMVDGSQSGANDLYGISLDNGYMSGLQPVGGGNIVIH